MAQHLEEAEQAAVMEWAAYRRAPLGPLRRWIVAIPNGAYLAGTPGQRIAQMARLKKAGLRPGAADFFVMVAVGGWHGLWVEMKKRRNQFRSAREASASVSPAQAQFREDATAAGYRHAVCYGFEEATEQIGRYLEGTFIEEPS